MLKKVVSLLLIIVLSAIFMVPGTLAKETKTKISVMVLSGGFQPAVEAGIKEFSVKTGINVEVVPLPYDSLREKQMMELTAGSNRFDVISIDGPIWLNEFYPFLEPLQSYVKKDHVNLSEFVPSMLEMSRYPNIYGPRPKNYKFGDGKLYTLPVRVGIEIMHYRKDLFEKYGVKVPKTWDEFLAAARKLTVDTDGDGKIDTYGVVLMGSQTNWLPWQWVPFLWGFGGDILNESMTKATVNSPQAIESVKFFAQLIDEGLTPPGTLTYDLDKAQTAMTQGLGAMYIEYSPRALVLEDPKQSKIIGKLAWAVPPYKEGIGLTQGQGCLSGWGMGINKYSKNKAASWKFIKYLTDDKTQLMMAVNHANAPTKNSVFLNKEYQKVFPAALATLEAMKTGKNRPPVHWTQIEDTLALELSNVLTHKKTAENAMNDAAAKIDEIIK